MGTTEILSILAPIILGALIGYVTNAIAIRMLFRPYKAWYLGKFKVPMTPGIIPRQRDRLAKSLGRMVAGELFQEDGIIKHLHTPVLQAALKDTVARFSSSLLGLDGPGAIPGLTGGDGRGREGARAEPGGEDAFKRQDFEELGSRVLAAFVRSSRFNSGVTELFHGLLAGFLDRKPGDPRRARAFSIFIRRELRSMKPGPESRTRLKESWCHLLGTWKNRQLRVEDLLGQVWIDAVLKSFESLYPSLEGFLRSLLAMSDLRKDLNERAFVLLSHALERLNAFQRSLLWIGGYEARLRESLPDLMTEGLESLSDFLGQEKTRRALSIKLKEALGDFARTPVGKLGEIYGLSLEDMGSGLIDQVCDALFAGRIPAFLENQGKTGPTLAGILGDTGEATWADILEDRFGIPCRELCTRGASWTIHRLRSPEGMALLENIARSLVKGLSTTRASNEGDVLEDGEKDSLDAYAAALLLATLETVIPKVLETFNLQEFVESRVAELDVKELEGLIIGLVGKEFTWINILGGVLGGLVGLMQVLFQALAGKV